ncbi:rhodanese-like domain-containing protein [Zophobihabitans entericus]|uniref:Rhodanese-like domain-containing protein n=1 Tax=Zophobihabitans entericus TaxID=1635327 RepID=A0A6G9I8X3_9GAMM|nr:rhodanese-like domain-containing protein [Zophobihabitans entericus]QIQ20307.1 rhodanese-like domain-containing protein [Zophobihabitans entericus]
MDFVNELLPFVKNHPILSLGWLAIFVAIIHLTIKSKFSKVTQITNGIAVNLMNKEEAVIVDIRNADNFKRGHITGSHNILPVDIKNNSIKQIEKFKTNPIIVTCDNGMSAVASGEILAKLGFEKVYALKDGIAGWNGENLPLVKSK